MISFGVPPTASTSALRYLLPSARFAVLRGKLFLSFLLVLNIFVLILLGVTAWQMYDSTELTRQWIGGAVLFVAASCCTLLRKPLTTAAISRQRD